MTIPGAQSAIRRYPTPPPTHVPSLRGPDPYSQAHYLVEDVRNMFIAHRNSQHPDVPMDLQAAAAGDFAESPAAKAIQPLVDAVKADADAAQREALGYLQTYATPPTADAQATAARYFDRVERQLGSLGGGRLLDAVTKIIESATPEQIPVLVEDLIPTLAAKGSPAEALTPVFSRALPEFAAKQAAATQRAKASALIQAEAQSTLRSITHNTNPPPLLDVAALANNTTPYDDVSPSLPGSPGYSGTEVAADSASGE